MHGAFHPLRTTAITFSPHHSPQTESACLQAGVARSTLYRWQAPSSFAAAPSSFAAAPSAFAAACGLTVSQATARSRARRFSQIQKLSLSRCASHQSSTLSINRSRKSVPNALHLIHRPPQLVLPKKPTGLPAVCYCPNPSVVNSALVVS